jgi:glutamate-1-semialdehyde aminotransferase
MKAFFVHDANKEKDLLVLPEMDRSVDVDRDILEVFISVKPDVTTIGGTALNGLPVETFGRIIASRSPDGDVCIVDEGLWQQRMAAYLGGL